MCYLVCDVIGVINDVMCDVTDDVMCDITGDVMCDVSDDVMCDSIWLMSAARGGARVVEDGRQVGRESSISRLEMGEDITTYII